MRILIWSERFWPTVGGVQVFLHRVLTDLRQRGHEVTVITSDRGEYELDGVPVHRVPLFEVLHERRPEDVIRLKQRVAAIATDFRPDVTHINLLGPGPALFLDAIRGATVVSLHVTFEGLRSAGADTLIGRTLRRASWVTACSQRALDSAIALDGDLASRSSVLPYGVDVPADTPRPAQFAPVHLVCVGRLVRMKGFDVAIEAVAALGDHFPGLTLTIAGDGPERPALEARTAAKGLVSRVRFAGELSHAGALTLMSEATIVLVPSRVTGTEYSEGLPFVVLEAGAAGRAVIGARAGGMAEAIVDGVTGVLVDPDDAPALTNAIRDRLADPAGTEAMGRRGHARIHATFTSERTLGALHALFHRVTTSA